LVDFDSETQKYKEDLKSGQNNILVRCDFDKIETIGRSKKSPFESKRNQDKQL